MINTLINDFSMDTLKTFFQTKMNSFKAESENYDYLFLGIDDVCDNYESIVKIGEAKLANSDEIFVFTAKTLTVLTNRAGKKKQYEIAKKVLKEENKDAAFFVFYDGKGNFRFSLIRVNFLGAKRDFTSFKRYTYFVSPEQTNKTFISQIDNNNFDSLDTIQNAFSVEPITREFYEKLQRWYFWAIENVEFPKDAENEKNGREVAVIRLITRLIFIWFMKVRTLVPECFFNQTKIDKMLVDISPEKSTYYKAILQNLFFATLSTKQSERIFIEDIFSKGLDYENNKNHVFGHHKLFIDKNAPKELFSKIPFLNGGLFECLDNTKLGLVVDGFKTALQKPPQVPNFLFFSEIQKVDISKYFETKTKKVKKTKKNKEYEVEGLINLLNSYNFTIDENEPDDIEVALDPELLGSIFENLLAAYNPETSTTARKATGSFYTPREIVNFMTIESLKQYFKTSLKNQSDLDEKLESLLKSNNSKNPFNAILTKEIINLINQLRVVDPAVGSGAFPMAMLNKLVFILSKLDPDNKEWEQSQIDGVKKAVNDPTVQRKLIEHIERQFKEKNADYGRKLYLIEKCIYGVDIQQIAVEISKLRFFISLLVDEKIDENKENYGIEPLPNLDFKIMQGNSLVSSYAGIDLSDNKQTKSNLLFDEDEAYKKLIKEFEELKNEYQNEADNSRKKELRELIDKTIIEIFEEKIYQRIPDLKSTIENSKKFLVSLNEKDRQKVILEKKQEINKKLRFDIEQVEKDLVAYTEGRKAKEFFLWDVYFAEVFSEKGGFDIVIGNPPYGAKILKDTLSAIQKKLINTNNLNSAALFIDFAKNRFINSQGTLSFIVPKSLLFSQKWFSLAKSLSIHTGILADVEVAFENVLLEQVLFVFNRKEKVKSFQAFKYRENVFSFRSKLPVSSVDIFSAWICDITRIEFEMAYRIQKNSSLTSLATISDTKRGLGIQKYLKICGDIRVIGGKNIDRFKISGTKGFIDKELINLNSDKIKFLMQVKLVSQDLIAHIQNPKPHIKITSAIDRHSQLIGVDTVQNTVIKDKSFSEKYILCLLNSRFINWFTYKFIYCSAVRTMHFDNYYIGKIPILKITISQQKPFETLVDKIISDKQLGEDTQALEDEIDIMVYKLYELTYAEVKIVDPEFALTEEQYLNHE